MSTTGRSVVQPSYNDLLYYIFQLWWTRSSVPNMFVMLGNCLLCWLPTSLLCITKLTVTFWAWELHWHNPLCNYRTPNHVENTTKQASLPGLAWWRRRRRGRLSCFPLLCNMRSNSRVLGQRKGDLKIKNWWNATTKFHTSIFGKERNVMQNLFVILKCIIYHFFKSKELFFSMLLICQPII